jgi:predicted transcriptional regulator YdeE
MQKTISNLPEIKLVGITTQTNNASETNPSTAKIGITAQKYFHDKLSEKIAHRKEPGTTYCVYTDYENGPTGNYTYFIGEETTSFNDLPEGFTELTIPAQNYAKFTSDPGTIPNVIINLWQKIWAMKPEELGGERSYLADFEIYDKRAHDHQNVVLDIYIGIKT